MRVKRRRLRLRIKKKTVEDQEAAEAFEGSPLTEDPYKLKQRLKKGFDCRVGYAMHRVPEAWIVPNTRGTCVVFAAPWKPGEWSVVHLASNRGIVYAAPSRRYCLRLMELILPRVNLAKWVTNFWDDVKDGIGDKLVAYIQHVWRADYSIEELPTVKQWSKSGLGLSHEKVNRSRGKVLIRKKRKRSG